MERGIEVTADDVRAKIVGCVLNVSLYGLFNIHILKFVHDYVLIDIFK